MAASLKLSCSESCATRSSVRESNLLTNICCPEQQPSVQEGRSVYSSKTDAKLKRPLLDLPEGHHASHVYPE